MTRTEQTSYLLQYSAYDHMRTRPPPLSMRALPECTVHTAIAVASAQALDIVQPSKPTFPSETLSYCLSAAPEVPPSAKPRHRSKAAPAVHDNSDRDCGAAKRWKKAENGCREAAVAALEYDKRSLGGRRRRIKGPTQSIGNLRQLSSRE